MTFQFTSLLANYSLCQLNGMSDDTARYSASERAEIAEEITYRSLLLENNPELSFDEV